MKTILILYVLGSWYMVFHGPYVFIRDNVFTRQLNKQLEGRGFVDFASHFLPKSHWRAAEAATTGNVLKCISFV